AAAGAIIPVLEALMFGRRRQIDALRRELEAARAATAQLRQRAGEAEAERDRLQGKLIAHRARARLTERVLGNLAGFGASAAALRESFADLAQVLADNRRAAEASAVASEANRSDLEAIVERLVGIDGQIGTAATEVASLQDRKSTRLNSSHVKISYAVFCLKKKRRMKMYQESTG